MRIRKFNENNLVSSDTINEMIDKITNSIKNIDIEKVELKSVIDILEDNLTEGDDNNDLDDSYVYLKTVDVKLKSVLDILQNTLIKLKGIE